MLQELQRRNYAQTVISSYIQIREYQAELFTKRKFAASTVTVYLAGLRFFYTNTLKRAWSTAETPYPKRAFSLPTILSQEEVAQLIDATSLIGHTVVPARGSWFAPKSLIVQQCIC